MKSSQPTVQRVDGPLRVPADNTSCCSFFPALPCSLSSGQRTGLLEARHAGAEFQDE